MGEAHLQGVLSLWEGDRWREVLADASPCPGGPALLLGSSPLLLAGQE